MVNRNIAAVIFLIVICGTFYAMLSNENINTTNNDTNLYTNDSNHSKSEIKEQVQVIYDGSWNGSITQGYSSNSLEGTNNRVYGVTGKIVSASFQKQDSGNGTLTVNLLNNGNIMATASTSASYGVIQTAYTF